MTLLRTVNLVHILRKTISSTSILGDFKYKKLDLAALQKHAYEDPHCGKEVVDTILLPDALGESMGKRRYELLAELYGEDPWGIKVKSRANTTKDDPHLVPSHNWRRSHACTCMEFALVWQVLYKDFPTRCKCGQWFLLLSYEDYYKRVNDEREKKYNEVKDSSVMVSLERDLQSHQDEFNTLSSDVKKPTNSRSESLEMLSKMKESWENIIKTRKEIENILDKKD